MVSKKVSLLEFEQNPNIGLFMFANDKFCLCGKELSKEKKKEIEKILDVPVYYVSALATELVGIFITGNNDFLIIPELFDYEKKEIEKIAEKHETKIVEIPNNLNTYGNNLCVGDKEIIINSEYKKKILKTLEDKTGYKTIPLKNPEHNNAGALIIYENGKYLVSQELEEKDVKEILPKISGTGSINSGSGYLASGVVCNKNGLLIGSMSSTIEIQNIVENLNFL
ncbi:MAG: hypothetical protein ACOCXG_04110 [Nanoarchaeota archaeon]